MSNILVILICIVIIAYKVMTQKPKAQKPAAPKPVIGFPEEEYEEEAETPLREEPPKPRKEPVRYTQQMRKPEPMTSAPPAAKPQTEKKGISLRTRNEARKAFIYSEIFKRKY